MTATAVERAHPPDRALPALAILQLVLLTAGWGGNAPALRYSLAYLPPNACAALRFALGLAVIIAMARWERVPLGIERPQLAPMIRISLLFAAQIALLNYGSALTGAARQSLLINSYPLYVPLFAHFYLKGDRLTRGKAAGTGLAFLGLVVVFGEKLHRGGGTAAGDLLVLASALLLAARVVYTSALVRGVHPYTLLFWQSVLALPLFIGASALTEPHHYVWTASVVFSIVYQGVVVAGLCFIGWTVMLQRYSASRLSVGFFMTPVFGALFSYALLHEPITAGLIVGGVAILGGLLVANRETARARA